MLHALVFALCFVTLLALVAGALRAGSKPPLLRTDRISDHCARYATDIMFGTATSRSPARAGWALIDRTVRAKRAVRLAVR